MRCPNLFNAETRKRFNELIERLGGRALTEADVQPPRQEYLGELTPAETKAYHQAFFHWNVADTPEAAHGFADALGRLKAALASSGERFKQGPVFKAYASTFAPESVSDIAMKADPMFAKYKAGNAQERDAVQHKSEAMYRWWLRVPEAKRLQFLSQLERGTLPEGTPIAKLGDRYRKMLDAAFKSEMLYGSQAHYVTDYVPHIWKDPVQAREVFARLRQTLGPRWFQKQRTLGLIEEGLKAGLKLKSTNPEQLITWRLIASADMKAKIGLLKDLEKEGWARPVAGSPKLENPRQGEFPGMGEEKGVPIPRNWTLVTAPNGKQWAIHPDLNFLWKNAMDSQSLWSQQTLSGSAYRGWMQFKNVFVPIRLALSLFHPVHILHINQAEAVSSAITHVLKGGKLSTGLRNLSRALDIYPKEGREARAAWLKPTEEQTPAERQMVALMKMGGFSPQLSEELRIAASRKLAEAIADKSTARTLWHGARRAIEAMQSGIFEKWIPNLKAAAFMNEARLLAERDPDLFSNESRRLELGVELRKTAKSIDNRFGEMFYGGLFWNRALRDVGTGSFLSLSWNLGFLREFGGGLVVDPAKLMSQIAKGDGIALRDVSAKTVFATTYVTSAMLIAGAMTWAFTGKPPSQWMDFILPRIGGTNPDGSPRRLSTPFFTREVPQFIKHVQSAGGSLIGGALDMLWNKTLFQPFVELAENRDYWGRDIWDVNAGPFSKAAEFIKWLGEEQVPPLAISQAERTKATGGGAADFVLSFMGFGPAPAYAARTATQNRIEYLYRRHVAPVSKPLEEADKARAKAELRRALRDSVRSGDTLELTAAITRAARVGVPLKDLRRYEVPGDIIEFQGLPDSDQKAVLDDANDNEFRRYIGHAHRDVQRVEMNRIRGLTPYEPAQ